MPLQVQAAGQSVQSVLTLWRAKSQTDLRERFQQAADEGDLPADADADADADMIARYLTTIADGVSVQAAGGRLVPPCGALSTWHSCTGAGLKAWQLAAGSRLRRAGA